MESKVTQRRVNAALQHRDRTLNAVLASLGLHTSGATWIYQKRVHAADGRVLTAGTAHHVWSWLRAIAEGRIEVPA